MSLAYKFLSEGAVGRFSGFAWPAARNGKPGEWVHAAERPQVCIDAVHACRARDLPFWFDDELWIVELGGEIVEDERKIAASSGRLIRQVPGWNTETARDFAFACALRTRDHALHVARAEGLRDEVAPLEEAYTPRDIQAAAAELESAGPAVVSKAAGYAIDAGVYSSQGHPATTAYIAAHAAASASGVEAALAERAWQVEWLVDRLALDPDA
jgi:hypothetical protein